MKLKVSVRVSSQEGYSEAVVAESEFARHVAELADAKRDSLSRAQVDVLREYAANSVRQLAKELDAQLDVLDEAARVRARKAGAEGEGLL